MQPTGAAGASVGEAPADRDGGRDGDAEVLTEVDGRPSAGSATPADTRAERRRSRLLVVGLVLLLAVPLAIALWVLARPTWFPVLDNAQTELRLRDVFSADPPLIGLGGRIGTAENPGSHPGPISFWMLAPFYELFGASAWAMHAASVSLHLLAVTATLLLARRRGGTGLLLAMGAVLALLFHAYGPAHFIEAWNPYMPVTWWLLLLLAVWSVLCDDFAMLPVAVFAASFGAQTHIPYVGLTAGMAALTVVALVVKAYAVRRDRRRRRTIGMWVLVASAVGFLLWLPPILDELANSPGNLSIILDHFSDPSEDPIGLGRAVEVMLLHLNPWRLATGQQFLTGSVVPGVLMVVAWAAAAVGAWRLGHRPLLRLHLVLAVAFAAGVVSTSRIFGFLWYYLVLWSWAITALVLLAVGWTAAVAVARRLDDPTRQRAAGLGRAGLAVAALLFAALFARDAAYVDAPAPDRSEVLGQLVPTTAEALGSGTVPGGGRDGSYLVTWVDPVHIGAHGYGLLNELERRGFDVGIINGYRAAATKHRVKDPGEYTGVVHMQVGPEIARWRDKPGVEEVAYVDPRDDAERARYESLRSQVIGELEAAGLAEIVPAVDNNLFIATFEPRVPDPTRQRMVEMADLGLPFAVFVGPPEAAE